MVEIGFNGKWKSILLKNLLPAYFILTFTSSWLLWFASGVLAYGGELPPLDRGWLLAQIGVFCPSLWGLVFTAFLYPDRRKRCLAILGGIFLPATVLGWFIVDHGARNPGELPLHLKAAIFGFGIIVLGFFVFSHQLGMVKRGPLNGKTLRWSLASAIQLPLFFLAGWLLLSLKTGDAGIGVWAKHPDRPVAALAVLFSFDMIFGGALGEEIGWRGFALPMLLRNSRPLGAALVLGVGWSLWHLPIDLTAGFGAAGLFGAFFRLLFTCCLSVIMTWYFIRSGHGLLTAFLIHTTLNWLPVMEFANYESSMVLLFIMMALFAAVVGLGDKNMRGPRGPLS